MNDATLIFPHQLFKLHPAIQAGRPCYLIEEPLFFTQYSFHKQKILFHRASMKNYQCHLENLRLQVHYIYAGEEEADIRRCLHALAIKGIREIHYADPVDDWLQKRIRRASASHGLHTVSYPSPAFLNQQADNDRFFAGQKTYFQTDFYKWQRKTHGILLDEAGKPLGGKWSFDAENRRRFPAGAKVPRLAFPAPSPALKNAIRYTADHFSSHAGSLVNPFAGPDAFYPVTFDQTRDWLRQFLEQRFAQFGTYEDAMVRDEPFLHHSLLTPMLNTGLITPAEILEETLGFASNHPVPLNTLEGFVRQIIGWREFIRAMYERIGSRQRTRNFWGFTRKIPACFWTGTTGITPLDTVIQRVLQTGYCHHIERLMVLGNFMLLCEFHPDEVYRWFMEMFIDAFDWVMVPNVYGMALFADGGLITTKPYISGSNYLVKMGNWPKGPWQKTWDGLFWRFLDKHRSFFRQNPRLAMLVRSFDNMGQDKKSGHLSAAESFLVNLA